ncbi:MAG: zinc ABC transporter substrate-binding protein [Bacteroidota bacterium]
MKKIWILSITFIFLLNACQEAQKEDGKRYLVATTGMIKDALENIAGDKAIVFGMMGPGVDPHLYKPTPGDLSELRKADIIFYNGLHLEGKMGEVFEKMAQTKPVFALADGIAINRLKAPEDASQAATSQAYDPHIWFDISLWSAAVKHAGEKLAASDKENQAYYLQNMENYLKELAALDNWTKQKIMSIPENQRVLITAHDAFGYFGEAYKIEVRGLQGISTISEFGLRDVSELVNFITTRKIKAVFVETSVSTKSLETVVSGCKDNGHEVRIGGTLYSDAMGEANTPEGTYIGMVKANVNTIVSNLK